MVQTDISQLVSECEEWRQILRNYREEFHECKKALQEVCRNTLSKDNLQEVEHYQNQFHIQLINIHDVKQSIKAHERTIHLEGDQPTEKMYSRHEDLLSEFLNLESIMQELRNDFKQFISRISCQ
jgi:predicted ribonuclease toxin of YeeF-YezG toxin-antitoxin module